jgi:hypothetical protein
MEADRELGDYFLDRTTDEVVHIPLELREVVEAEAGEGESPWDLPEWEQELKSTAEAIYVREDPRFVRIPEIPSRKIYERMVEFAQTVADEHVRELLEVALDGPGAFRRFKDILARFPHEQERWHRMKDVYLKREAREWLEELKGT